MKSYLFLVLLLMVTMNVSAEVPRTNDPAWVRANVPQLVGVVGGIGNGGMLVGDRGVRIDAQTRYINASGLTTTLDRIKPGDQVMVFYRQKIENPVADRVVVMQ